MRRDADFDKDARRVRVTDGFLRRFGFKIHSRLKDNEPVWEREGRLYRESVARELAEGEKAERGKQSKK